VPQIKLATRQLLGAR